MLWWEYVLQYLGEGFSWTTSTMGDGISTMGRREWTIAFFAALAWGAFCLRGFGKRI